MKGVDELEGACIQGWELTSLLGRGADGVVYRGEREGREVAVKVYFPDAIARNGGMDSAKERLDLQLTLVGKKVHPNLVEILGGGFDEDLQTLILVMELVPGRSVDRLVGHIPKNRLPDLVAQLASACQFLESVELVHRDIKPANIMIDNEFSTLTLLDLSVIHHVVTDNDDKGRLSGDEFVATLRYSPPEFVWRTEEAAEDGAWRAITFYQIGATLHDMIMGLPIFTGFDKPHACLYDSVRDRTPRIECAETPPWLIQVARSCLLKEWRQRLGLLTWDSFLRPPNLEDTQSFENRIRLRQVMHQEELQSQQRAASLLPASKPNFEQELWKLNELLMIEVRSYLLGSPVFPRGTIAEDTPSRARHTSVITFEADAQRGFPAGFSCEIALGADLSVPDAFQLTFVAICNGEPLTQSNWTEPFTVETAFKSIRQAILNAVEAVSAKLLDA